MATNLLPVQPLGVTASVRRSSDNFRRKTSTSVAASAGNNWWTPLFGWSSEGADYIDSNNNNSSKENQDPTMRSSSSEKKLSKFVPGCFTEEKARRLRMMTMETETFHEVMYHSAIAARLATDFPRRSNE